MTDGGRVPLIAAAAVIALGTATTLAALDSGLPNAPVPTVALVDLAAGASFAVVGAVLWRRYPSSRIGAMTVAVGLASFLADLRWFDSAVTWTVGAVSTDLHLVTLAWVLLAFPSGRLSSGHRWFVVVIASYWLALSVAGHLFEDPVPGCGACPENLLLVRSDPSLAADIWDAGQILNLLIVGILVALITSKWSAAGHPGRRAMAPVIWALGPIAATLAIAFVEPLIGFGAVASNIVLVAERLALVVFPLALVAGMVRARLDEARVGDLASSLEGMSAPDELEGRIAEALGDPNARLAFWSDEASALIDASGAATRPGVGQEVSWLTRAGGRMGAMFHDPNVSPSLVDGVAAAAGLALHNERLRAELRRRLAEVAASRERIARATIIERRRVERDLHDGAQQRLLALGALLGRIRVEIGDGRTKDLVEEAISELRGTIDELREFARGIHPSLLAERGLGPAIEALAERSEVPVELDAETVRCRSTSEMAAYFVVAESITNATKHASPEAITVRVQRRVGDLVVSVLDDGAGGADPGGPGLTGLADRVEALGGTLSVRSGPGAGTTVEAVLPCE